MIREYTATGATVEEAIENACRELGVSPLDVTPEILRLPKKGFFKKVLAEVRITVQSDDELLKEDPAPVAPPKKPAPVREKPAAPAPAPKKEEPKPAPAEKKQPAPQPVPAAPQPAAEAAAPAPAAEAPVSLEDLQPKINVAEKYLLEIFEKMGLKDIQVRFEQTENRTVLIHIDGGDIGTVIGKRGETLGCHPVPRFPGRQPSGGRVCPLHHQRRKLPGKTGRDPSCPCSAHGEKGSENRPSRRFGADEPLRASDHPRSRHRD